MKHSVSLARRDGRQYGKERAIRQYGPELPARHGSTQHAKAHIKRSEGAATVTQQVTDPWAAASAGSNGGATSAGTVQQAATAGKDASTITDPFGGSSSVPQGGGAKWDPRVPFDEIEGRTVVMVPRSFDPAANDPFNEGKTREEYRVDLVILDGNPFSFTYRSRPEKGAELVEQTMEVKDFPAVFRSQSIAQGQLIKALKWIDQQPDKLFLAGVLLRVPFASDRSESVESIAASRQAYVEYVKRTGKTEPDTRIRSTWNVLDDPKYMTPDRWERARAWWEQAKTTWPTI